MTINEHAVLLQPGQGISYWVLGDLYTFKTVGKETDGKYSLIEIVVQPSGETPLHIHSREAEAFYIQEGELEFQLDDQIVVATEGTFLHSPPGQSHRFVNVGSTPTKMLCWLTPAGLEKFFMEVGTPADNLSVPPSVSPADIQRVIATAPKYGLEILPLC